MGRWGLLNYAAADGLQSVMINLQSGSIWKVFLIKMLKAKRFNQKNRKNRIDFKNRGKKLFGLI